MYDTREYKIGVRAWEEDVLLNITSNIYKQRKETIPLWKDSSD